ncbi:PEP-CTERM sorting domain-containing protein [Alteromonas flava]|uniref:PEP-CTERM sorting domain-containing protein n=1 Tax=Alteromonas flava TaxID=2048003 RepID=UPI000C290370|nr:PEP-CTERM sorting domain-containing protein [Alteromonas flava]
MKLAMLRIVFVLSLFLSSNAANASLVFTNLNIQSNSITFTVNGDMSGYTAPGGWAGNLFNFNLRYIGDLWAGGTGFVSNSWSTSVFDSLSFSLTGNTGLFSSTIPYTWSEYAVTSLSGATATNRTVTLSFSGNVLNTNASNGAVEFYWGWANTNSDGFTLLGSLPARSSTVTEPSTLAILGLALIGFGMRRLKK